MWTWAIPRGPPPSLSISGGAGSPPLGAEPLKRFASPPQSFVANVIPSKLNPSSYSLIKLICSPGDEVQIYLSPQLGEGSRMLHTAFWRPGHHPLMLWPSCRCDLQLTSEPRSVRVPHRGQWQESAGWPLCSRVMLYSPCVAPSPEQGPSATAPDIAGAAQVPAVCLAL